ncbi:PepSY domain-containing protein [Methylobacterium sp. J-076]|uniref:PepSY domain-containing protein n=1 Tax=Methylobacterium sp. J-076 TaxID=2836655 RepID=UPI001FB898D2|nr:PepSY domain-containing protein [Methylobacterium sp. J-076]MCJ2014205.1 PepSY domain-containing protein [Methylobacterium sp. J-076]
MRLAPALAALAFAVALAPAPAARADTPLPDDQKAKVEAVLKQEGFTKWSEIELDDGMIEVDDAYDAAGKKFDLKLDPKTLAIVKRKND